MGLLQKLGLVEEVEEINDEVVEETTDEQVPVEAPSNHPAQSENRAMRFAPTAATTPQGTIVGEISSEVYDKLSEAIERENLEGNDFLEFMQALQNLSSLNVDENNKFNMVFTTLSTSAGGMTKEFLISSISHYVAVLEKEHEIFSGEMQKATTQMVDETLNEVDRLNELAAHKAEQIQALQAEIGGINENVSDLKQNAEESKFKIAKKEADFNVTFAQLKEQLSTYETKINNYIK